MTESAAYPKTGQSNSNAKTKLQLLLRQIEKASRLSEFRVDRIKDQLRHELIDLKANKLAMKSHAVSSKHLNCMDESQQRDMLKVVSQRGRYYYSLKSEVKFHIDRMSSYNPRLERAKRLLIPARQESLEAMERGVTNLPDLDGSLAMKREMMLADGSLVEGERRKYGKSTTPECLIFPRI
ncbi:uncharacterized protein LOC100893916 [Strongylocentrotus purpuratus]|uniref:Uncharacterized protein n=1 Tax=Strongylocentrotus purpuratus TaxID=7668 RepID=A0A7M7GGY5_STRPU|nr:uncharacterized protein LOC100893916 [Strongylocentrotus purpuratus]|eukprot:XP_003726557.1 PREDICTED: uncharacterized protein LOC100893916 [Strongylocentrotus purpuratus]